MSSTSATVVQPDAAATGRFFRLLYSGAPRGYLTIMRKKRMSPEFFDISFTTMADAAALACKQAAFDDVYFGVGLRAQRLNCGKRGDADSVIVIPGFWTDCDIRHPSAHAQTALPPDEDSAMLVLNGAGIKPSLIARSGHGFHGYYLFGQPLVVDSANRDQIKVVAAKLYAAQAATARRQGWKLDNASNLAHILRPGGTVNRKDANAPKLVTFEYSGIRYDLAEIEAAVGVNGRGGPSR